MKKICNISGPAQFKHMLSKGQLYIKHVGFSVYLESLLLRFPSPGTLLDPGMEPLSPTMQAGSLPSEPPAKPAHVYKDPISSNENEKQCSRALLKKFEVSSYSKIMI